MDEKIMHYDKGLWKSPCLKALKKVFLLLLKQCEASFYQREHQWRSRALQVERFIKRKSKRQKKVTKYFCFQCFSGLSLSLKVCFKQVFGISRFCLTQEKKVTGKWKLFQRNSTQNMKSKLGKGFFRFFSPLKVFAISCFFCSIQSCLKSAHCLIISKLCSSSRLGYGQKSDPLRFLHLFVTFPKKSFH